MTNDEQYIYNNMLNQVRMGFQDPGYISEMIREQVEDEDFDISDAWVNELVAGEYRKLEAESKTWQHPTDTERLATAFNELIAEQKIVALHNAGYTTADGEQEVLDIERKLRISGLASEGYCFYHEQDLERALSSQKLGLAYQKINNEDDAVTLSLGRKIAEKLKQHGFQLNWDENVQQKIEIAGFKWQKIYTANEGQYQHDRVMDTIHR